MEHNPQIKLDKCRQELADSMLMRNKLIDALASIHQIAIENFTAKNDYYKESKLDPVIKAITEARQINTNLQKSTNDELVLKGIMADIIGNESEMLPKLRENLTAAQDRIKELEYSLYKKLSEDGLEKEIILAMNIPGDQNKAKSILYAVKKHLKLL